MEPSLVCTMPGRPKKKKTWTEEVGRRRKVGKAKQMSQQQTQETIENASDLPLPQPEKLSKRGWGSNCIICHKHGHNRATCKDRPESSKPRTPSKKRRTNHTKSTNLSGTPQTQNSTQQFEATSRPKGGRAFYKTRTEIGTGVRINEDSGWTIYNPGMTSQVVINEGTGE